MSIGMVEDELELSGTPVVVQDCAGQYLYHHMHGALIGEPRSVHLVIVNPLEELKEAGACKMQALYWFRVLASKCSSPKAALVFSHADQVQKHERVAFLQKVCHDIQTLLQRTFKGVVEISGVFHENCTAHSPALNSKLAELVAAVPRHQARGDLIFLKRKLRGHQRFQPVMPHSIANEIIKEIKPTASIDMLIDAGAVLLIGDRSDVGNARVCTERATFMTELLSKLMDIALLAKHTSPLPVGHLGAAWRSDSAVAAAVSKHSSLSSLDGPAVRATLQQFGLGYACQYNGKDGLLLLPMLESHLMDSLPRPVWPDESRQALLELWRAYVVRDERQMLPARFTGALIAALHGVLGSEWHLQAHGDGAAITSAESNVCLFVHVPGALIKTERDASSGRIKREQHRNVPRLVQIEAYCRGPSLAVTAVMMVLEGCIERVRAAECSQVRLGIKTLPPSRNWTDPHRAPWPDTVITQTDVARSEVNEQLADRLAVSAAASTATAELSSGGIVTVKLECRTVDEQLRALKADQSQLLVAGMALDGGLQEVDFGWPLDVPLDIDGKQIRGGKHVFELRPTLAGASKYMVVCLCMSPTATTLEETIIGPAPLLLKLPKTATAVQAFIMSNNAEALDERVAAAKQCLATALERVKQPKLFEAAQASCDDASRLWEAALLELPVPRPERASNPALYAFDSEAMSRFGFAEEPDARSCIDGLLLARLAYEVEDAPGGAKLSVGGQSMFSSHAWALEPEQSTIVEPFVKALRVKTLSIGRWYRMAVPESWHTCRIVLFVRADKASGKKRIFVGIRGTATLGDAGADVAMWERFYRSSDTHHGFKEYGEAALRAVQELCGSLSLNLVDETVSFSIGGHSLGGGASLVLHKLLLEAGVAPERLHTTTFAAPIPFAKGVVNALVSDHAEGVDRMFNFAHINDPVPMVPPQTRVGRFFYFASEASSSRWSCKYVKEPCASSLLSKLSAVAGIRVRYHFLDDTYKPHFERLLQSLR
eukprot:m.263300 g.263300  ORF g.263300 m.263300 type:complete len:1000 (+) comp11051_c2_seq14:283-3282(+)